MLQTSFVSRTKGRLRIPRPCFPSVNSPRVLFSLPLWFSGRRTLIAAPPKPYPRRKVRKRNHEWGTGRSTKKVRRKARRRTGRLLVAASDKRWEISEQLEEAQSEELARIEAGTNTVAINWEESMRSFWESLEFSDPQTDQCLRLAKGIPPLVADNCANSLENVDESVHLLLRNGSADLQRNLKRCAHLREAESARIHIERLLEILPMADVSTAIADNPFLLTLPISRIFKRKLVVIDLLSDILSSDPRTKLALDRARVQLDLANASAALKQPIHVDFRSVLPRPLQKGKLDHKLPGLSTRAIAPGNSIADESELVPFSTNLALFSGIELFDENNCLNRSEVRATLDWEQLLSAVPSLLSFGKSDLTLHAFVIREVFNLNNDSCGMLHSEFLDLIEAQPWLLKPDTGNFLGKFRVLAEFGARAMVKNKGHVIGPKLKFTSPHLIRFDQETVESPSLDEESKEQQSEENICTAARSSDGNSDESQQCVIEIDASVKMDKMKSERLDTTNTKEVRRGFEDVEEFDLRQSAGYKIFLTTLFGHVRVLRYPWQRIGRVKYWLYNEGMYRTFDLSNIVYTGTRSFYLNAMREMLHCRYSYDDYYADEKHGGGDPALFFEARDRLDYEEFLKRELRAELDFIGSAKFLATVPKKFRHIAKNRKELLELLKKNKKRLRALNVFIAHKEYSRNRREEGRGQKAALLGADGFNEETADGSSADDSRTVVDECGAFKKRAKTGDNDADDVFGDGSAEMRDFAFGLNIERGLLKRFDDGYVPEKVAFFEGDAHIERLQLLEWMHGEVLAKQYTPSTEQMLRFLKDWDLEWPLQRSWKPSAEFHNVRNEQLEARRKQKEESANEIKTLDQLEKLMDKGRSAKREGRKKRKDKLSRKKRQRGFMPDS